MNFLLHARLHALEHGAASSKHDVTEEVAPDVTIAPYDGLVGVLMDSLNALFHLIEEEAWLEENLRTLQTHSIHCDVLLTWQLILLRNGAIVS